MANDFTGNPWNIDTVFATPISKNHITNCMIYIKSITWSDQAANDHLTIQDRAGRSIQDVVTLTANTPIILNNPGWVEGIQVTSLGTGRLSVVVSK